MVLGIARLEFSANPHILKKNMPALKMLLIWTVSWPFQKEFLAKNN